MVNVGYLLYNFQQADVLTESALLIPMLRRIQFMKTTKFMKFFVFFLARFAIVRGSVVLHQVSFPLFFIIYLVFVYKYVNILYRFWNQYKRVCL